MGRNLVLKVPQIKRAAQMYAKGMSRREIAAQFGCSEAAVVNGLAAIGVRMRDRKEAVHIALVRRSAAKPPHYEIGSWAWMNPANAELWQTREVA